jgi:hypothetical protein
VLDWKLDRRWAAHEDITESLRLTEYGRKKTAGPALTHTSVQLTGTNEGRKISTGRLFRWLDEQRKTGI